MKLFTTSCLKLFILFFLLHGVSFGTENGIYPKELHEGVIAGKNLLLEGKYLESTDYFLSLYRRFPTFPVGALGAMLAYQAVMIENSDYTYEEEYERVVELSSHDLKNALRGNPGDPWTLLLSGGSKGVQGMFHAQKGEWLKAFMYGIDGVGFIKEALQKNPNLADGYLGLGLYHYWRSAKRLIRFIPFIGDKREQGIKEIKIALSRGTYTREIAEFALVYIYEREKNYTLALELSRDLSRRYPQNALFRIVTGKILRRALKHKEALQEFESLWAIYPQKPVVLYQLGISQFYEGSRLDLAEENLRAFLNSSHSNQKLIAFAHFTLGNIYDKQGKKELALREWNTASRLNPNLKGKKGDM